MYIKVEEIDGGEMYLNTDYVQYFRVEDKQVVVWFPDNLSITLKKTKPLKEQLDKLAQQSSKGFEQFT